MKTRILSAASIATVVAGALAAATAAPPGARTSPLRVAVTATASGAVVEVAVTNTSRHTVRVPRWQLPGETADSRLFRITRDSESVAYEGPMAKRGLPQAADFLILRAGETRRSLVDLADSYDFSRAGQYTVQFAAPLQFASTSDGAMLRQANGLPMVAQSAPVRLWVQGKGGTNTAARKPTGGTVVGGVTYKNCSSTQISTAGNAVGAARQYSEDSKGYLAAGTVGPRYSTWFGAYTSQRFSTASQHFVAIDAAMDQSNGEIAINCSCNQSYYAYVYPTRPYEIFVCRAFWSAPLTGTDSKAGTLIHEVSHFNVVAATDDHVYGQTGARNLAISDPNAALDNADNHEYFAENTPQQN